MSKQVAAAHQQQHPGHRDVLQHSAHLDVLPSLVWLVLYELVNGDEGGLGGEAGGAAGSRAVRARVRARAAVRHRLSRLSAERWQQGWVALRQPEWLRDCNEASHPSCWTVTSLDAVGTVSVTPLQLTGRVD